MQTTVVAILNVDILVLTVNLPCGRDREIVNCFLLYASTCVCVSTALLVVHYAEMTIDLKRKSKLNWGMGEQSIAVE